MSLTTPYREQFLIADGSRTTFPFDDHGDGFDAISKNYVKCEVYNADGSVIVPDFTVDLSAKTITITSLTTPDGQILNAPQSGAIVRIYRDVPETQNTTVQALQASTAKQIVQNFDNIVAMIQELQYANEHFTLRSTLPQRDLQIDLLRDIDDQKLVYWDKEKRKLVVTNYRQDEILLPTDKEDILSQANKYSDAQNNVLEERINDNISSLESTINGKLSAVDTQIDANADAILKTREDFASADQTIRDDMNAEDSRLQTQITAQATAITTNKNDIDELGDDLAEIQAKIPESASGTNHLITKQQLLDEEMDIRDDMNQTDSELQSQITVQAAAIATLDAEKLDKNQGDINAGKYLIVGNDGNIELTTSGGGGGGLGSVTHDETLSGAGTEASPLGVAKNLSVEELTVGTDEGTLNLSITAGVATIATNNGLDIVSPTKFDAAPTTDDATAWADVNPTALVTKQQVATAVSEAGSGSSYTAGTGIDITSGVISVKYPVLTNKSPSAQNVVYTNDNTISASITNTVAFGHGISTLNSYGVLIGMFSSLSGANAVAIGDSTSAKANGVAVGRSCKAGIDSVSVGYIDASTSANSQKCVTIGRYAYNKENNSVAIGYSAGVKATDSIAIGKYATVDSNATHAIQIGSTGSQTTNSDANTFKVGNANGNFEIMSADGTIPAERMSATAGTTGQVLTKTDTGMVWQDSSGGTTITLKEYDE